MTTAAAAGLAAMAARHGPSGADGAVERAEHLRRRAGSLADDDVEAYAEVLHAARAGDDERRREALHDATEVPLEIVRCAAEVAELAAPLAVHGSAALRGDARAAVTLAEAASRAAADLVAINTRAGGLGREPVAAATAWCEQAAAALASLGPAAAPT